MKVKRFTSFAFILLFFMVFFVKVKVDAEKAVVGGVDIQFDFGIKSFNSNTRYLETTSSEFEICFSAHGNGSDSWKFYNCRVQICTSYKTRNYTSLLFVQNAIVDEI